MDMCGCCISMLYSRPVLHGRWVQLSGGKEIGWTQTFNFTSWGRAGLWPLYIIPSRWTQISHRRKIFLEHLVFTIDFSWLGSFSLPGLSSYRNRVTISSQKRMIHISTYAIWILTKKIEFSERVVSQPWKWMTRSLPAWNLLALWFPACETRR